jgi:hypothetical protein
VAPTASKSTGTKLQTWLPVSLAEQLRAEAELERKLDEPPIPEWVSAKELASRLGRSVEFIYNNADSFGVKRVGEGPKPRMLFPADALAQPISSTRMGTEIGLVSGCFCGGPRQTPRTVGMAPRVLLWAGGGSRIARADQRTFRVAAHTHDLVIQST